MDDQQKKIPFPELNQRYRAMYKRELAEKAGVTLQVLRGWIKKDGLNVPKSYKMLPPNIVKELCERYVIFIDD